jgi:hypothetical protein
MGELLRSPAVADASLYRASSVFSRLCSKLNPLLLARLDDKVAVSGEGVKSLSAGPVWYDDVQRQHAALTGQADWQRFVGLFSVAQSDIGETGMVELSRVLCRNDIVIGTVPQIDYPSLISRLYRSARLIKLTGLHHVTWDTGNPHGILQRFPSAALPGCYATGAQPLQARQQKAMLVLQGDVVRTVGRGRARGQVRPERVSYSQPH